MSRGATPQSARSRLISFRRILGSIVTATSIL